MADRVIVAVFKTQNQAYDAAREIQELDKDGFTQLKRGAIMTKDAKGNLAILDTKGIGTVWGLVGGSLIGGLLGALLGPVGVAAGAAAGAAATGAALGATAGGAIGATADLGGFGMSQDFIDDVSTQIYPGETALLAELDEGSTVSIDRIVARHGGRVSRSEI